MNSTNKHKKITDLQTLRAEKQRLKHNIRMADDKLRIELELLPPVLINHGIKEVMAHFRLSKLVGLAGALMRSPLLKGASGKGMLAGMATEAAVLGGIQLATRLFKKWRK